MAGLPFTIPGTMRPAAFCTISTDQSCCFVNRVTGGHYSQEIRKQTATAGAQGTRVIN